MKLTSNAWGNSVVSVTLCSLACALACSSARLDPNTRAITFVMPTRGVAGATAGDTDRDAQTRKSPTPVDTSSAGAGGTHSAAAGALAGAAGGSSAKPMSCAELPDPAASLTDRWVSLGVRFERGKLDLVTVKPQRSRHTEASKRRMGRFAAELWIGCELIDRVRFDFPMLVAKAPTAKPHEPAFVFDGPFDATVVVPDSERATRLEIVDREQDTRRRFDWPLRLP